MLRLCASVWRAICVFMWLSVMASVSSAQLLDDLSRALNAKFLLPREPLNASSTTTSPTTESLLTVTYDGNFTMDPITYTPTGTPSPVALPPHRCTLIRSSPPLPQSNNANNHHPRRNTSHNNNSLRHHPNLRSHFPGLLGWRSKHPKPLHPHTNDRLHPDMYLPCFPPVPPPSMQLQCIRFLSR